MPSQNTMLRQPEVALEVQKHIEACGRCFGREHALWMDLTLLPSSPQRHIPTIMAMWNKLNAAYLSKCPELVGWLRVVDPRHSTGALHIHGLLVTKRDAIRPAFPSEIAGGQTNPWSLNAYGQALEADFMRHAQRCGFGRGGLEPVYSNFKAVAIYQSKSFRSDIFSFHPFLLGAQRFRISAKLKRELLRRNMGWKVRIGTSKRLKPALVGSNNALQRVAAGPGN